MHDTVTIDRDSVHIIYIADNRPVPFHIGFNLYGNLYKMRRPSDKIDAYSLPFM